MRPKGVAAASTTSSQSGLKTSGSPTFTTSRKKAKVNGVTALIPEVTTSRVAITQAKSPLVRGLRKAVTRRRRLTGSAGGAAVTGGATSPDAVRRVGTSDASSATTMIA